MGNNNNATMKLVILIIETICIFLFTIIDLNDLWYSKLFKWKKNYLLTTKTFWAFIQGIEGPSILYKYIFKKMEWK